MDLRIGKKIGEFRKEKGMTQDQLAQALGVSAPAVSKWETGSSYPDITMLCPLARVLGTDVDALLEYEEILTEEKAGEYTERVIKMAREQGVDAAERMLQDLLHQHPNSAVLKYYGANILTTLEIMFQQPCPEEKKAQWKCQREEWLREVYASGATAYFQPAVFLLASGAIADGELDKAEQLLKELPEQKADGAFLWVRLYLARGETEKAKEMLQRYFHKLVAQVQGCLSMMMGQKLEPDLERELEIWRIYCKMEEIFGCGANMSEGLAVEIYQRADREEEMLQSLLRFADQLAQPLPQLNPLLFSSLVKTAEERYVPRELRQVVLHSLLTEEAFDGVRGDGRFVQAVEKMKGLL